ncbi:ester cyclase [Anaerobaca lacustris]|uniref:Nuclear transport factor 2 family protein n=1 Tax=Anaerobaca lacustris TaxID=3044600 RepID=A0AAW6U5C3_9BACT|nr:nuclear transport factor 2 family protein [Sedimentisphaerales bacterium M17dextr]
MNATRTIVLLSIVGLLVCGAPALGQSPEDLMAVRGAFADALNAHDLDAVVSFLADDFVFDWVGMPTLIVGPAQFRASLEGQYMHSPDWHTDEGRVFATDNVVVVEHAAMGTQTGPLAELPDLEPQGNPWAWYHVDIYEFEGDKIKRLTSYGDTAGVYMSMGVMPVPEMPDFVPSIAVPAHEPTGLSPLEANAEHVRRWNSHDAASMAKIYHADCTVFAGPLGMELDRVAMTAMNEVFFSAFPDVELEIVRTIDLGNGWVLTELLWQATHQGTFFGIPPMGYATENRGVWLVHYTADGLVREGAFYYDNLTLMTQMTTPEWPLDGIWVSTVPTPLGNLVMTTTYVAQDAARTMYSGSLEEINAMPLLAEIYPDADPTPKWAGGHAVKVGRHQYEATYLGYSVKIVDSEIGRTTEFVGLFTVKAYFQLTGPDQLSGHGTGSYYLAAQDANRDGFPDEGEEPVVCVPWEWTGRRLTTMPGCVPTPMP